MRRNACKEGQRKKSCFSYTEFQVTEGYLIPEIY